MDGWDDKARGQEELDKLIESHLAHQLNIVLDCLISLIVREKYTVLFDIFSFVQKSGTSADF